MSDKITQKIAAIFAKAESTTFEGEAQSLLAKAKALMEQHGIDMFSIKNADDPVGVDEERLAVWGKWQVKAFSAIASFYGCYTVSWRGQYQHYYMAISGKESSRATVRAMWPYVKKAIARQANEMRAMPQFSRYSYEKALREVGTGFAYRVWEMVEKRNQQGTEANALIVVDQAEAAMRAAVKINDKVSNRGVKPISQEAYNRAANIGLHHQTDDDSNSTLAIEYKRGK